MSFKPSMKLPCTVSPQGSRRMSFALFASDGRRIFSACGASGAFSRGAGCCASATGGSIGPVPPALSAHRPAAVLQASAAPAILGRCRIKIRFRNFGLVHGIDPPGAAVREASIRSISSSVTTPSISSGVNRRARRMTRNRRACSGSRFHIWFSVFASPTERVTRALFSPARCCHGDRVVVIPFVPV